MRIEHKGAFMKKLEHNKLPEVNQFIKETNLTPCDTERMCGSLYNKSDDITYLVVYEDNTYISYGIEYFARREVIDGDGLLVICRGKIYD
jgi:hypothetical protein